MAPGFSGMIPANDLHCRLQNFGTDHAENTSRGLYPLLCDVTAYTKMYLPRSCLKTGCITPLFYCFERVLPRNGCFCGSTVLAWSKYDTALWLELSWIDMILLPWANRSSQHLASYRPYKLQQISVLKFSNVTRIYDRGFFSPLPIPKPKDKSIAIILYFCNEMLKQMDSETQQVALRIQKVKH
jgi:hypothetical protein